jgi:hypothetical protein
MPSMQLPSGFALWFVASLAIAQTSLGNLLDGGATRLSSEEFRRELVGRPMEGPTPTAQRLEVVYLGNGEIRGVGTATMLGGAGGGAQTFDIQGSWTIDGSERICTSMLLGRGVSLPPRCQFWYKYDNDYFFSDSDSDRSARVVRRTVKH